MVKWKKIVAAVLAAGLLAGTFPAFAAEVSQKALFDVVSLGIIEGDENGDYQLDSKVTRAEFAAMMIRTMYYPTQGGILGFDVFTDVHEDDWFYDEVSAAYAGAIMQGKQNNIFDPLAEVTYNEAVKTMVTMLGFAPIAEQNGGYPAGYLLEGSKLDICVNVPSDAGMTRGDVVNLIYNSLDVNRLTPLYNGSYEQREGDTLRSLHMADNKDTGLVYGKGIVESTYYAYLYKADSRIRQDEVYIGGTLMKVGTTSAADYLGYEVEYYYRQEDDGTRTLVNVRPTKRSSATAIDASQLLAVNGRMVEYFPEEGGRKEKVYIDDEVLVLKNDRPLDVVSEDTFRLQKGSMTFIDNIGDEAADVVLMYDYTNVVIKAVNGNVIELNDKYRWNGSRYITVEEDADNIYLIQNAQMEEITLADLQEGDVLSIISSVDSKVTRFIVSSASAEGVLNAADEDYVTVDETAYPLYEDENYGTFVGKNVTLRLDYKGYVADCKEGIGSMQYGYVVEADSSAFGGMEVKMLLGASIEFKQEKNEQNLDDANKIPTLVCRNSDVVVCSISANATVNGIRLSDNKAALQPGVYEYKRNAEGKITRFQTPMLAGGGSGMKFNAYDNTFGGNNIDVPFGIDQNTNILCVPKNRVSSDEDYLVPLVISNKIAGTTFDVTGYGYDSTSKKVDLVVFQESMSATTLPEVKLDNALVGLVSKKITRAGENDTEITSYTLLTAGGEVELEADLGDDPQLNFKVGDLIWYVKDNAGDIANGKVIYHFAGSEQEKFFQNEGRENEILCGQITDISYHDIDPVPNELITTLTVVTDRGAMPVKMAERNAPPIFLYKMYDKDTPYAQAGIAQMMPGNATLENGDYVFVVRPYGEKVKACVIIRK